MFVPLVENFTFTNLRERLSLDSFISDPVRAFLPVRRVRACRRVRDA